MEEISQMTNKILMNNKRFEDGILKYTTYVENNQNIINKKQNSKILVKYYKKIFDRRLL